MHHMENQARIQDSRIIAGSRSSVIVDLTFNTLNKGDTMMTTTKVWFVTGASKGLGLILVRELLKEGYAVAATSRNPRALETEIGKTGDRFLPLGELPCEKSYPANQESCGSLGSESPNAT